MKAIYEDILALSATPPIWYDENGTPRYAPHSPDLCPDIYANMVGLVSIECQSCQRLFQVQVSARRRGPDYRQTQEYGDPPHHEDDGKGGLCAAGVTMTAIPVTVLECWERINMEWRRYSAWEGLDIRPEWSKD